MENEETINGNTEAGAPDAVANHHWPSRIDGGGGHDDSKSVGDAELADPEPPERRREILKALEAVERDSAAIAESFSSLFSSLRLSLSQVAIFYLTFNYS